MHVKTNPAVDGVGRGGGDRPISGCLLKNLNARGEGFYSCRSRNMVKAEPR